MFFTITLYISLAIFGLGLIYKVSNWFRYSLGIETRDISTPARVFAAIKGITWTLLSLKIFTLVKVFVLDVLLQLKVLQQDFLNMDHAYVHVLRFPVASANAWSRQNSLLRPVFNYYPTVNPFLFLRNLFGVLILVGIGIAIYRRFILRVARLRTSLWMFNAIAILAVIMISGFLLESTKITSYTKFQDMVEEYTIQADEEELRTLEAYWVAKYGVVSPEVKAPFDAETLEEGQEAHEMSCVECHSRPQWGFASYTLSRITKPAALVLDRANIHSILWYLHFLACF